MVAMIDYDAGNLRSVEKALIRLGEAPVVTREAERLLHADKVILPGVGSFGDAMDRLTEYGLVSVIREIAAKHTPLLGICLGLQLMFESSEEAPGVSGLGLLDGVVRRIPKVPADLKIPHIGWNSLHFDHPGKLFEGLPEGAYVYFVHSFYLEAADPSIVTASTYYGTTIHASVEKDNLFACQFHPEKSSDVGLRILKNFMDL